MERRMQWLGHLARMDNSRMPKRILFGRLRKPRPSHGVKLRWKDRVKKDMSSMKIYTRWYEGAQDRKRWYKKYQQKNQRTSGPTHCK